MVASVCVYVGVYLVAVHPDQLCSINPNTLHVIEDKEDLEIDMRKDTPVISAKQ